VTRLLGIDLGDRRIGVALGDDGGTGARGLVTIRRGTLEHDTRLVERLCAEHRVSGLVVGLPLRLDGSEGSQAAAARTWGEVVGARLGLPVAWRDERLTSVGAEASVGRMSRAANGAPPTAATRERHRAAVDRDAARRILQAELDARRTHRHGIDDPFRAAPDPTTGATR